MTIYGFEFLARRAFHPSFHDVSAVFAVGLRFIILPSAAGADVGPGELFFDALFCDRSEFNI
ncbi:hypothetical protein BMS3Bbin16_00578 [archaeon BMS3Bbin16]|nr:hypothetical protein BMS3Bbin16_00578 [archaeon BMS3Bbin16]